MTTITTGQTTSLVEMLAAGIAGAIRRRRAARGQRGAGPGYIGELLGTVAALVCLIVAAFTVGFAVGMAASGVALLLLDFKVALVRRARAKARR